MKKEFKKQLIMNLPYLLVAYVFNKVSWLFHTIRISDLGRKILYALNHIGLAFRNPIPSFQISDVLTGILCALLFKAMVYLKSLDKKKYRTGVEYGSARWGTREDIAPYMDEAFFNNIILTKSEFLMISNRPKNPKYARNNNVVVIGGSGSGKTAFWLTPNLLQMHSSYVITDPKGGVVVNCGHVLLTFGYRVKVFNTINFKKSMHYNPLAYIHSEKDILKLVTVLITNTKGDGQAGDEFWIKSETLLYTALIGYIHYEAPIEEQNFATLIEFINAMEVREDDEDFKNPVDLMFDELEERKPDHFAVRQYKKYKLAAGKTAKSILVSCGARLAPFDIQELREITAYDELQLDTLGDEKTALFLIMSDTDATFNFLISMIYTQLFNLLCEKADDHYHGKLPVHVRCLIDETANIGQIPNLEKLVATIRSREISACLFLQAKSQLKAIYKDKKSIKAIVSKLSETINVRGKAWNQDVLIMKLNEQIRGWTNYHQSVSASEAFAHLDYVLFELLWHWAKRRHPKKGKWWISTKYWHRKEKRNIIKVVDSEVFDSEENSLALSKEAFASYILEEDDNFKHVSVDGFESIFNIISDIINGVYE